MNETKADVASARSSIEPGSLERSESTSSVVRSDSSDGDERIIKLISVYNGSALKLSLPPPNTPNNICAVVIDIMKRFRDLLEPIRVCLPDGLDLDTLNKADVSAVREAARHYNKAAKNISKLWNGTVHDALGDWKLPTCTVNIALTICGYAFECAIPQPKLLNNHYAPFSSQTYGETRMEQMALLIEQLHLSPNDVFVDLGSGVGNIVAFTAAMSKVKKCVGIECAEFPADCANKLQKHLKELMVHFGKSHSPFELHKDDFLNPKYRDLITKEATVIFINNFAFDAVLDSRIKQELIAEMSDGIRIITTKRYANGSRGINQRKMGDVEAMLEVQELATIDAPTSWTDNHVPYWLHTVNRAKMERFFFEQRGGKKSKTPSASSSSRESSQSKEKVSKDLKKSKEVRSEEGVSTETANAQVHKIEIKEEALAHDDEEYRGRTTRRMWKEWTGGAEAKKPEPASSPKWNEADREYVPPAKKVRKPTVSSERKKRTPVVRPKNPQMTSPSRLAPAQPQITTTPVFASRISSVAAKMPASVREQIPAETLSVIGQMHDSALIASQQVHPAHEELARGELVRISLNPVTTQINVSPTPMSNSNAVNQPITANGMAIAQQQIPQPQYQPLTTQQAHIVQPQQQLPPPQQLQPQPQLQTAPAPPAQMIAQPVEGAMAQRRHTFMLPPTDPLYDYIVSLYLEFKTFATRLQNQDEEIVRSIAQDIEREKMKKRDLTDQFKAKEGQIEDELALGVGYLKERLVELDMAGVQEVSELLTGSKQIVAHHKELTQKVAKEEALNAQEEQKIRDKVSVPLGDRLIEGISWIDEHGTDYPQDPYGEYYARISADFQNPPSSDENLDQNMMSPGSGAVLSGGAAIVGASSRRSRPRQRAGTGTRRGGPPGGGVSTEENREEIDLEIKQFVEKALIVDRAVKEKERRARGSGGTTGTDRANARKNAPSTTVTTTPPSQPSMDSALMRSGPLILP